VSFCHLLASVNFSDLQASKWDFICGGHQLQISGEQIQILVAKVKKNW
jgi:hypothetical protein